MTVGRKLDGVSGAQVYRGAVPKLCCIMSFGFRV